MQGIFINGERPKFKKDVKTYVEGVNLYNEHGGDDGAIGALETAAQEDSSLVAPEDPYGLVIEATSIFGNEFDGSLAEAMRTANHGPFSIVGPDPHTSRKWYLTLRYIRTSHEWTVK